MTLPTPVYQNLSKQEIYFICISKICRKHTAKGTNPRPDFEQFMKEFDTHFGAKWDPFGAGQIIESIESFLHLMLPGSSLA